MKTITQIGRLLAVCLLWSACSQGGQEETFDEANVPLKVGSAGLSVSMTRNGVPLEDPGAQIGIYREATGDYAEVKNQCYSYATPFWQADTPILLGMDQAKLSAVYPYNQTGNYLLIAQSYNAAMDICFCRFTADAHSSSVTLNMERVMSLIRLRVAASEERGKEYNGDGFWEEYSLFFSQEVLNMVWFIPHTGQFIPYVYSSSLDDMGVFVTIGTVAAPLEVGYLMIPQRVGNGDLSFQLWIDGKRMSGKVNLDDLCGGELKAGMRYDINITVYPTGLSISGIEAEPWVETNVSGDYEI